MSSVGASGSQRGEAEARRSTVFFFFSGVLYEAPYSWVIITQWHPGTLMPCAVVTQDAVEARVSELVGDHDGGVCRTSASTGMSCNKLPSTRPSRRHRLGPLLAIVRAYNA